MNNILLKIEDLIEEVETEDFDLDEILQLLYNLKNDVEEKIMNEDNETLSWGDLDWAQFIRILIHDRYFCESYTFGRGFDSRHLHQ